MAGIFKENDVTPVRSTKLPAGDTVPVLGLGTWMMGQDSRKRKEEVAALQLGLDLGMTLIDTAEMYADGGAERVVGAAIAGRRDEAFVVSKVLPQNATRRGMIAACEQSLKRLNTDRMELYLLHKIRRWGVSNFDVDDMEELLSLAGGDGVATNQVMYNLKRRGIEYALIPWSRKRHIPIMAYSPLDQAGSLLRTHELRLVADRHGATPAQIALAWTIRQEGVFAIPKAGREAHLRENHAALSLKLSAQDLADLDRAFPPPAKKKPLEST